MVQTWQTQAEGDDACPRCGSVYSVTVTRLPVRDSDSFNCRMCGAQVRRWSGTHDYSFNLKKPNVLVGDVIVDRLGQQAHVANLIPELGKVIANGQIYDPATLRIMHREGWAEA